MRLATQGLACLAAAFACAACATAIQQAYVAPTDLTIRSETDEGQGNPPSHTIYVVNRSTVRVTVFGMSLHDCENVKQRCESRNIKLPVGPGQRILVTRVEPESQERAFSYRFGFSWTADSADAIAARALAASGGAAAGVAANKHDSSAHAEAYHDLTRADFSALRGQATRMRPVPESLVLRPGERTALSGIHLELLDKNQRVLGRTRWAQPQWPAQGVAQYRDPDQVVALRPGRTFIRYSLVQEAQHLLAADIPDVEVPLVVAYRFDAHSPTFAGRVVDADTKQALKCARVALEDSAENTVSRSNADSSGAFSLRAPMAGTFRLRVDVDGWAPSYGPVESVRLDQSTRAEYPMRFTEQQLVGDAELGRQRPRPAAVTTLPATSGRGAATAIVQGVTLGGSESMPILGIIGRVAPTTIWAQFAVNDTGRIDTTSVILSPGAPPNAHAAVLRALPQLRFSPAKQDGHAECEMVRLQVNFSPR